MGRSEHFAVGADEHWNADERDAERRVSDRSVGQGGFAEMMRQAPSGSHVSDFPVDAPSQASSRYQYGGWGYRKHSSQPRY